MFGYVEEKVFVQHGLPCGEFCEILRNGKWVFRVQKIFVWLEGQFVLYKMLVRVLFCLIKVHSVLYL